MGAGLLYHLFFIIVSLSLQVFESLKLTAYDLNVDMLDVHAVSCNFH